MLFGKAKLLREGAQIDAVVIGLGGGSQRGALFRIRLRVKFEDGAQVELWRRKGNAPGIPWVVEGELVPLRYDCADRTRIEIDFPTWRARCEAKARGVKDAAIQAAEEAAARASKKDPSR